MTPEQVALVQNSWKKVLPIRELTADFFYTKLFELDFSLKPLFAKTNMKDQRHNLMAMISVAVSGLSQPETILSAVEDLGRRHAAYGVKESHYETVGRALLWTLERGLGDAFTPAVKEAWISAYTLLSNTMKNAADNNVPA